MWSKYTRENRRVDIGLGNGRLVETWRFGDVSILDNNVVLVNWIEMAGRGFCHSYNRVSNSNSQMDATM